MRGQADNPLWVVTSYFNPSKYRKRFENFVKFREALDAPLLVVELQGHGVFELSKSDADAVIQLRGEPAIWQKERLINVGIRCLPDHVDYVAWIDCDLAFENCQWVSDAIDRLAGGADLVQLFSGVIHQRECQQCEAADFSAFATNYAHEVSVARILSEGGDPSQVNEVRTTQDLENGIQKAVSAPGHAWAARVDRKTDNQLYDANILGGGDRVEIATSLSRQADRDGLVLRDTMSNVHYQHQKKWIYDKGIRSIDYIPGRVFHYWHGSFKNRKYLERAKILVKYNFDPVKDLKLSDSGAWEWTHPGNQLALDVAHYFRSRQEDG